MAGGPALADFEGGGGLIAKLAHVDTERRDGHGIERHGAHPVVGAENGAEKVSLQVELLHVVFEREMDWLCREIADDYDGRIS